MNIIAFILMGLGAIVVATSLFVTVPSVVFGLAILAFMVGALIWMVRRSNVQQKL